MTHAWCSDPARDQDVRAAEDGRQGPLPTLEEAISRAGQFTPSEAPQGAKCTERDNGLRTERVTIPWQREKWDEALAVIVNGGEWGRGNGFHAGIIAALVIWADKTMVGLTAERDAAIRERDEFRRALNAENDHALRIAAERDALKARVAELEAERDAARAEEKRLKDVVRQLSVKQFVRQHEAAPAASVAANSSAGPKSSEPVAWGQHPASGWLAQDEIAVCVGLRDFCRGTWETWGRKDTLWLNRATTLAALLARSSPPEVVLPGEPNRFDYGDDAIANRDRQWRAALADAGVTCKEVGK